MAIDQRGQGHSEGRRHVYENEGQMIDDQMALTNAVNGYAEEPVFLLSHSLGGAISLQMSHQCAPGTFKGLALV